MGFSETKQFKVRKDKRKVMMEKLFEKLENSEDRALLLLLVQSFEDEING
jgi:hypothetical protein